jgi:micrococcal nuclease
VVRAVDGDTLALADGTLVRVIGLDAPETRHPDMTAPEPFGAEAAARAGVLVDGREVGLEPDLEARDRFGRTLAHVWVDGRLFSEIMIEEGLATVLTVPPNVKYQSLLRSAEDEAHAARLGLWALTPTPLPVFGGGQ